MKCTIGRVDSHLGTVLKHSRTGGIFLALLALGVAAFCADVACAQSNILLNGSFETADIPQGWLGITNWSSTDPTGGVVVADAGAAQNGVNYMRMNAFGAASRILQQRWPAQAGKVYRSDAYLMSPAGANYFMPSNGYCSVMMQFYNSAGSKVGGNAESPLFRVSGPTSWTKFTSAPMVAPAGTVTGRTLVLYVPSTDRMTNQYVLYDNVRSYESEPTMSGALKNPDFETLPAACCTLQGIPYWTGLGNAGGVVADTNFTAGGKYTLAIWWQENLLGQTWPAVPGTRYSTSAKALSPVWNPLATTGTTHGAVILEFFDANTNLLGSYVSQDLTPAMTGTWVTLEAQGVAPQNTAFARTLLAVLGGGMTGGLVYFDDTTQQVLSSGPTSCGKVVNPGFEDGPPGNAYDLDLIGDLAGWKWLGGTNAGFVQTTVRRDGGQAAAITYPNNLMVQEFVAATGRAYAVEGYIYNPSSTSEVLKGSSWGQILLEFRDPIDYFDGTNVVTNTIAISTATSGQFTTNSPSGSWVKFSVTNYAPNRVQGGGSVVTGRLDLAVLGDPAGYSGALYFDDVCVTEIVSPKLNTSSGALLNPGFEFTPKGTLLSAIDNWENNGFDGVVDQTHVRSGLNAVRLYYTETLVAQTWPATAGNRYSTEGYAYTPSSDPLRGSTNPALQALVILEYLNSTGGVLITYISQPFGTNAAKDAWTLLHAEGIAPANTVQARTYFGIVGKDDAFAGSVWFDDFSQSLEASGPTSCGLLSNPGFDDGVPGNADNLQSNGDFKAWTWLGGTNGGFVQGTFKYDGGQALAITWPHQLAVQTFPAVTGMSYVLQGRIFNPGTERLQDTAYGVLLLQFLSGTNVIATKETLHFTTNSPADTWVYFCTTSRAPSSGSFTGRVAAFLQGDEFGDSNFAGAVYFDAFCVTATNIPFTGTQSGALYNPGFEDSGSGTSLEYIDNWQPYGNAGALQSDVVRSGNNALQIYYQANLIGQDWTATAGDKYRTEGYVLTPSSNPIRGDIGTNTEPVQAVVVLQFLDATNGILISYPSQPFLPSSPKDTWTKLESIGVAPQGTVKGRTLVGLIGQATNFNGLLYVDDTSQALVWSDAPVYSLIRNAGFDDGPPGNIALLTNTYDLPAWTWLGGTNAGFIQREVIKNEEQAAAITFPGNLLTQEFVVPTGRNYVVEGYIQNPTSATMSGTAYGVFLLEFLDQGEVVVGEGTNAVVVTQTVTRSVAETLHFTTGGPSNTWVKFSVTNRAPWTSTSGSIITGRVAATILGSSTDFLGALYFDDLSVRATNLSNPVNYQSGLLWNPGFEYTAKGTALQFVDNWDNFGLAGVIGQTHVRSGANALQVYFTETLAGQTWPVTPGASYRTEGYVFTPSANPLKGNNELQGLVILQFLNSTGGVVITYPSATTFTTGSVADTWTLLAAEGVAPAEAVLGRTLFGVVGTNANFSGEVWFDDLSQSLTSTGAAPCGILVNPGFDDGIPGNAWDLDPSSNTNVPPPPDNLPGWSYLGGPNAAFVAGNIRKEGSQSLILTYPANYVVQDFRATGLELLKNKGFEQGPAGGAAPVDWFIVNNLGQQYWAAETGTNGMAFHSWNDGAWGFFGQEVDVNLSKGSVFQFSIRGNAQSNFSSYTGEAYIKVEFWKRGEGSARSSVQSDIYPNLTFAPGVWSTYTVTATNADSQVDMVKVLVGYGNASDTGGDQSVFWDNASLLQGPPGGYTYVASGYLYTPSTAKFQSDGTCWGEISLVYFADETNLIPEFTAASLPFTQDMAADTWHYFSVTSTVPFGDNLKGRLMCVINNSRDPAGDLDLGGIICYDSLCLQASLAQPPAGNDAFADWQMDTFGSTNGPNVGATEDYDFDTFDNWSEFIAGTDAKSPSSYLSMQAVTGLSNGGFIVKWPSSSGRYYTLRRSTNGVKGSFSILASGMPATAPQNVYTDNVPLGAWSYIYKVSATTNQP